jgi:type IV conjugative transfer system protein TraL
MKQHVILNYVDTPLKILFWTVPEILMLIIPLFIGLIINQLMLALIVIIGNFWVNKKYQQQFGKGQFQAVLYWFLPADYRFKTIAPSFIREYVG